MLFFSSIYQSIKNDLGACIATFLETGSDQALSSVWSKLKLSGAAGMISREEIGQIIVEEGLYWTAPKTLSLYDVIDKDNEAGISKEDFMEYFHSLRSLPSMPYVIYSPAAFGVHIYRYHCTLGTCPSGYYP